MTWDDLLEDWLSDAPCLRCFTSGSTGIPKEILIEKEQIRASARRTLDFFGLSSGAHFHSALAPDYIGGKMMLIRALEAGASFSWEKPSNRPLQEVTGRIDMLCVVPSQMLFILENIGRLPDLGIILIGGSAIPENLRSRIAASPLECWETYGMTETASHVALRRVAETDEPFTPLPGISVSTRNDCLAIDIQGWKNMVTNDIAEVLPDGRFRIRGRADNVIVTGGLKVHPEEVERKLSNILPMSYMISGEDDEKWGQRVILTVEDRNSDIEGIMATCRRLLRPHEVPKEIRSGIIPHTPNGKIKRR